MRFEDWEPHYRAIVAEFGFSARDDATSARRLADALSLPPYRPEPVWAQLERALRARPVLVLGAADSAPRELRRVKQDAPLVAADGATTAALEENVLPTLIVSDLDGRVEDEVAAVERGSCIAVHAHGDNRDAVDRWLPRFNPSRVVGTCQTRPIPPLRNFGGFTDGDRACFIAHGLGAARLRLVGFDFFGRVGPYTGPFDPAVKARKLEWARRLLGDLQREGAIIDGLSAAPRSPST